MASLDGPMRRRVRLSKRQNGQNIFQAGKGELGGFRIGSEALPSTYSTYSTYTVLDVHQHRA